MELNQQAELVISLLVALGALAMLARRVRVPYPVLFVLGGLLLALVPGLPAVELAPDLVFLLFLPPLIYVAAVFIPLRDVRAYLRPISVLAVGLVLVMTAAVAVVAHAVVEGLTWPSALVLGALLSPTDAVAVVAVGEHVRLPDRAATILEAESLLDDASGLVLYRLAVTTVLTGGSSLGAVGGQLLAMLAGGVVLGLSVGWLGAWVRRHAADPRIETLVSLLIPFTAWVPAEQLGFSGAVAVVTAGIFVGRSVLPRLPAGARLQTTAFWEVLTFLLEGLLFILVGLQLPSAIAHSAEHPASALLWYAVWMSLTVIGVRIAWVFASAGLARIMPRRGRGPGDDRPVAWKEVAIVAWAGMRGGDSLAAALAVPVATADGSPFPERGLLIFLTFCVILATLVVQGLSLPWLAHHLRLGGDALGDAEQDLAERRLAEVALGRLKAIDGRSGAPAPSIERLRRRFEHQLRDLSADGDREHAERHAAARQLHVEVVGAQRQEAVRLRDQGQISDDVLYRLLHSLDLEEEQLDAED